MIGKFLVLHSTAPAKHFDTNADVCLQYIANPSCYFTLINRTISWKRSYKDFKCNHRALAQ